MRSVKMGQGYFDILKAETAMRKKALLDKKKEEEERNKFQPARITTTEPSDSSLLLYSGVKRVEGMPDMILRPFTPVYSCLVSSTMDESHVEPLFRQLCALHWLLEALTIDHNHHGMRPVITCWNEMDPGGIKNTLKKINKDKVITHRWEHFIMPPKTKKYKMPAARFVAMRKSSRKASTISLTRTSGGSSPQSSMLSVNPTGSDDPQSSATVGTSSKELEDNESSSTKQDDESIPISLQKLMEMVREDARRTVLTEDDSYKKIASTVSILKPSFRSDTNLKETTQKSSMTDKSSTTSTESFRRPRRRQEERGIQKFLSFGVATNFYKDVEKMRHPLAIARGDAEEIANHWYFDLLSKLPEDLKRYRPAKKILQKLQKHGENLDLRIRPHVLLKVLQDLRSWELCSPDIAVAIEFVREHIVQMPQVDYIRWLRTRVNLPMRSHSAPPP
ncbi:coiled-coil domain-containing protein 60 [Gracilinanus agilis]|uniref:coiled-coil domain-containing protein 60 n=1 Tax=Gracilinanus agilis TaxID=191870 RepID=UPI001CFDCB6F|nr:coiled-coil domain-containing protein 60 [Gracilinanus agilis]